MNFDSFSLGVRHLFQKLVFFFMLNYTCDTLLFSEYKSLSELLQKNMYSHLKKKYFDSLALKPLELYVNLVGRFVAYSQSFNLVYR
jgi:hypothetical protein